MEYIWAEMKNALAVFGEIFSLFFYLHFFGCLLLVRCATSTLGKLGIVTRGICEEMDMEMDKASPLR